MRLWPVVLLLCLMLPVVALAGSGSYRCEGTRHPSGTDEPPRAFVLPDVSAATAGDAAEKARHENITAGYTTDSVSCRDSGASRPDPGRNYSCTTRGWCTRGPERRERGYTQNWTNTTHAAAVRQNEAAFLRSCRGAGGEPEITLTECHSY